MPDDLNPEVLKRLARLGAQARLDQIEGERRAILAAFPDLSSPRSPRRGGRKAAAPQKAAAPKRRRKMSAAERKEVSERMKRYWAEQRKKKAAKAKG